MFTYFLIARVDSKWQILQFRRFSNRLVSLSYSLCEVLKLRCVLLQENGACFVLPRTLVAVEARGKCRRKSIISLPRPPPLFNNCIFNRWNKKLRSSWLVWFARTFFDAARGILPRYKYTGFDV